MPVGLLVVVEAVLCCRWSVPSAPCFHSPSTADLHPQPLAPDHRICEPAGFCAAEGPLPSAYAAITAGMEGAPTLCDLCSSALNIERVDV